MATRLLLVKADGSVSIHADGGASKPLNWMAPPCSLIEADDAWVVANAKGETLTITIDEVLSDSAHEPASILASRRTASRRTSRSCSPPIRPRIEAGLGAACAASTSPTSVRSICCATTLTGRTVAVEIKRRGEIDGVEQLARTSSGSTSIPRLVGSRRVRRSGRSGPRPGCSPRPAASRVEVDYDALRACRTLPIGLF